MPQSPPFLEIQLVNHPVEIVPLDPFPKGSGGECVFLGRTRGELHPEHGELIRLHYEAYQPMAEAVLRTLTESAVEKFDCLAVRVHHAIGDVRIGEASVLIQVAAGLRDESFRACRFLIDAIKSEAPIWKQEIWEVGSTWSRGTPVLTGDLR